MNKPNKIIVLKDGPRRLFNRVISFESTYYIYYDKSP